MRTVAYTNLASLTDSTLVTQYQLTNNEAYFTELYHRYYEKMNRYCLKALHNQTDAADMTQEVFIKVLDKLPTLNNPDLWIAWLFRIAHNLVINLHRRRALHRMDSFEENPFEIIAADGVEEKLEIERKLMAIPQLLDELPSQQAKIIRLKYLEGRSIEDLCEEFHIKESAVKMRLLRARTLMVKKYEAQWLASA